MKRALSAVLWKTIATSMLMVSSPLLFPQIPGNTPPDTANPGAQLKSIYSASQLSARVPPAKAEDVASPKALVLALHASITGSMDSLDWQRFRSLFLPGARIGQAGTDTSAEPTVVYESVEDWLKSTIGTYPGVTNQEVIFKMHVEQYGSIANVFYSHSAVETRGSEIDNVRRVNSCQMLFDGKRWWIASVIWNVSSKKWDLPAGLEP